MPVATQSMLTEVLEYMKKLFEEDFNGDLNEVAREAAKFVKENSLASGPLWDEIGVRVLKQLYRVQIIGAAKASIRKRPKVEHFADIPAENQEGKAMNLPYNIGGRYYNLFDLTKPEVEEIAEYYANQSASYEFEYRFLEEVASSLGEGQRVRDVFDIEGLRQLRKKLAA